MSWSGNTLGTRRELLDGGIDKIEVSPPAALEQPECADQIAAAKAAATSIVEATVVVPRKNSAEHISVAISGHANPKHEIREGYATDQVSVAVTQINTQGVS